MAKAFGKPDSLLQQTSLEKWARVMSDWANDPTPGCGFSLLSAGGRGRVPGCVSEGISMMKPIKSITPREAKAKQAAMSMIRRSPGSVLGLAKHHPCARRVP